MKFKGSLFHELLWTNIKIIFLLVAVLILSAPWNVFAQVNYKNNKTRWTKWGKAGYSYAVQNNFGHRNFSFDETSPQRFMLKSMLNAYWFFISDVDGDNCSFNPTCSNFFLKSVEMTNIFQGTLMFFDRFTRDMDIFGKSERYPYASNGYFYDPPSLYTLNNNKIRYIPPSVVVNNE